MHFGPSFDLSRTPNRVGERPHRTARAAERLTNPTIPLYSAASFPGTRVPVHLVRLPARKGLPGQKQSVQTTQFKKRERDNMGKRLASKYKINRRIGENLWGRPKSPVNKRDYRPGQHGQRRRKPSDFGTQLMAKQKLKGYYGNISEKQFRRYYAEASRRKGDTSENLIGVLERRLDAVVYRMKFVPTVFAARQFVNHGHVMVNGKKVNIPSYVVQDGDVIEVREKSRQIPIVLEAIESAERDIPDYMDVDLKKLKGTFVRQPKLADVPYPVQMEPNLVVEFYSR